MSFLFGASRDPDRDRELAEGNERTRRAFARDINDERSLAFDGSTVRRKRRGTWMIGLVIVFLLLGAAGLLPKIGGIPLRVDCDRPGVALGRPTVQGGALVQWRATGPDDVDYVLTLDATSLVDNDAGLQATGGTVLSPAFRMSKCQTGGAEFRAPEDYREHTVRLFRKQAGVYVEAATASLIIRR